MLCYVVVLLYYCIIVYGIMVLLYYCIIVLLYVACM